VSPDRAHGPSQRVCPRLYKSSNRSTRWEANRIQKQNTDRGKEAILPPPYRDHPQIIPVIAHVADLISSVATGVTGGIRDGLSSALIDRAVRRHLRAAHHLPRRQHYRSVRDCRSARRVFRFRRRRCTWSGIGRRWRR
jgi:hypothetical protein